MAFDSREAELTGSAAPAPALQKQANQYGALGAVVLVGLLVAGGLAFANVYQAIFDQQGNAVLDFEDGLGFAVVAVVVVALVVVAFLAVLRGSLRDMRAGLAGTVHEVQRAMAAAREGMRREMAELRGAVERQRAEGERQRAEVVALVPRQVEAAVAPVQARLGEVAEGQEQAHVRLGEVEGAMSRHDEVSEAMRAEAVKVREDMERLLADVDRVVGQRGDAAGQAIEARFVALQGRIEALEQDRGELEAMRAEVGHADAVARDAMAERVAGLERVLRAEAAEVARRTEALERELRTVQVEPATATDGRGQDALDQDALDRAMAAMEAQRAQMEALRVRLEEAPADAASQASLDAAEARLAQGMADLRDAMARDLEAARTASREAREAAEAEARRAAEAREQELRGLREHVARQAEQLEAYERRMAEAETDRRHLAEALEMRIEAVRAEARNSPLHRAMGQALTRSRFYTLLGGGVVVALLFTALLVVAGVASPGILSPRTAFLGLGLAAVVLSASFLLLTFSLSDVARTIRRNLD